MLSEFEKQILRANQLILRDRVWNDLDLRSQAKITDENISRLLNPKDLQESEDLKRQQAKEIEVHDGVCGETCSTCDDAKTEDKE